MTEENTNIDANPEAIQAETIVESSTTQTDVTDDTQEQAPEETIPKKRFNKVYWEKNQAQRENAELKRQLEERNQVQAQPAAPEASSEPTLEQYDYDQDAYTAALVEHKVQTGINSALASRDQDRTNRRAQAEAEKVTQKFNDSYAQYSAENPEYEELAAVAGNKVFAKHVNDVVLQSDNGPAIDHYLLQNPDVAEKLGGMSPVVATMELGKISAELSTKTKQNKTTGAPPPIETVGGGGTPSVDTRYNPDTSMDDYYKQRMQGAVRR